MRCLIIKKKWLNLILSGEKTLEIRGSDTHVRGKIGLIESGSGTIVGYADLLRTIKLDESIYESERVHHRVNKSFRELPYFHPYAWVLGNVKRIDPVKYKHPQGAVIWVHVNDKL